VSTHSRSGSHDGARRLDRGERAIGAPHRQGRGRAHAAPARPSRGPCRASVDGRRNRWRRGVHAVAPARQAYDHGQRDRLRRASPRGRPRGGRIAGARVRAVGRRRAVRRTRHGLLRPAGRRARGAGRIDLARPRSPGTPRGDARRSTARRAVIAGGNVYRRFLQRVRRARQQLSPRRARDRRNTVALL
jgi:hypothetical protein